jgi:NADH-quinone oxidoreductase subunit L
MYQAIVFLPLLGSIIAAFIALAGAHARCPGGSPPKGAENRIVGTTPEHPHSSVLTAGASAVPHTDAEPDHSDAHASEEPPAAGSRAAELVTTTLLFIAMVLSWIAFFRVGFGHQDVRETVMPFIVSGDLKVDWALRVDALTAVMLVVVTTVSALVHLYSIGYMEHDPYRPRFFSYLSLFTFAMLVLVTADNLVQLFVGWEGVGLASYLLIGFWYHKPEANAAAIKAFIVNRIGDFGFALGIFAVFMMTGAVDFGTVFAQAPALVGKTIGFFDWNADALTLICLLLFMGAMGKSAQFLLHTWLPDAMEGPTPVSALIHAATMVTAGVFMVARLSPLFQLAPDAQTFVVVIGATTAMFAATIGLVQNDIKRIIAYSTCSQLGYMFVAMGVGAYSVGMFHLFTHAFFKALLFLGAGSVITAMHHEQDIRHMGGLWSKIPFTYATMLVGTLSLTGFPLFAGYFSKDAIIESAAASSNPAALYGFLMTLGAAALTAFYSWRLIFKTFHGAPHDDAHHTAAHESPPTMLIPLFVLGVGSVLAGFPFLGVFEGQGAENFFGDALRIGEGNPILNDIERVGFPIEGLPTLMMVVGFLVAWQFYIRRPDIPETLAREQGVLYRFLLNKWYFDEIYDVLIVRPVLWLGRLLWKGGDGWLIDGFGPDGVSAFVLDVTRNVVRLQTGYLYHYAFAMLIGVAAAISWFMFLGGGH